MTHIQWNTLPALFWLVMSVALTLLFTTKLLPRWINTTNDNDGGLAVFVLLAMILSIVAFLGECGIWWPQIGQAWFGVKP